MSIKPSPTTVSALIGLGGNVGDVVGSMQRAIDAINIRQDCNIAAISKIYRTPPWGITDQDWFYNACADVETNLDPDALLDLLLTIELAQGRVRDQRWGPRTLDLDIIAYGNDVIETDRLSVPHPRMHERAFVVLPLMDICPERFIGEERVKDYAARLDLSDIKESEEVLEITVISSS